MSYSLTDYSATEVELNDGLRSYYYKKCYCSVELQGEYIVFTSHKVENNAYRQSWTIAYTDFTTPTGSAATVLAAIKAIIDSYVAAPVVAGRYGQYLSYTTQNAVTNNVGKAMIFESIYLSNGVTVVTDGTSLTRITFGYTGIYNLQFSTQFQNNDNAQQDIYIWLRKNGTTSASDVTGSTGFISIPARKSAGAGNEGHVIIGWNFLLDITNSDWYQIMWATSDVSHVQIKTYPATVNYPSTASTLFTATQIK